MASVQSAGAPSNAMITMQTHTSAVPTPKPSLSTAETGTASPRASSDEEPRPNYIGPTQVPSWDLCKEMASQMVNIEVADLRVEVTTGVTPFAGGPPP